MSDFIKKASDFASKTEKKANELVYELYKKGKTGSKEAKKMTADLKERVKKGASDLQKKMDKRIYEAISRLNIPTRKEIEAIKKRLSALEKTKKSSIKRKPRAKK